MTLTSSAQTIPEQSPADFGQRIAADYWRKTPHVFSNQGKDNERCGLCLVADTGQHRAIEPYGPRPTIASVVNDAKPPYYRFSATLSCGHGPVGFATTPAHAPVVGATYDCWDCRRPIDDRNQPGLPEAIREQIEAALPQCPKCGGPIEKIPFIKRTVHKYQADVEFRTGEILAGSEHDDTLEEIPDWIHCEVPTIEVECAEGHSWFETRLVYRYKDGEHIWRVLPPSEALW